VVIELVQTAAYCLCAWSIFHNIASMMDSWAERAKAKAKLATLQDRIFRDACDTIHHLRVENDALTAMVMARQGEKR
jgi:hypothetical protein